MKTYKDLINENESVNLEEASSSSQRKPIEAVAKKIDAMQKTATKMEDTVGAMYDKLGDRLKKAGFDSEADQVEDVLSEVSSAANDLYRAARKASKELYNIGSRF